MNYARRKPSEGRRGGEVFVIAMRKHPAGGDDAVSPKMRDYSDLALPEGGVQD